jgi:hypothetical protein
MPLCKRSTPRAVVLGVAMLCGLTLSAYAATMSIINMDAPGEGFNDPTPVSPIGGNPGVTLGEQRLHAAQFAADLWAARLNSNVDIKIEASFDALGGSHTSGALAGAIPVNIFRDFPGAPMAATWYPAALANALAGVDLDPMYNDVSVRANSDVDGAIVLGSVRFYYGLDLNAGTNIDFVSVFTHELGHGLGFVTFLDRTTGAKLGGKNDVFMLHLIHRGATPPDFPSMTDAQRLTAMTAGSELRWNGPHIKAVSGLLTAGGSPEGDVNMFAPNPLQPGTSIIHFSPSLTPDELMEPAYREPHHEAGLALPLLQDLGWQVVDLCGDILLGQEPCTETLRAHQATREIDVQGHIYTFAANAGDHVDLRLEATASTLDPALILLGPHQELLAMGDDELPCPVPLVCGGACPQIQGVLPTTGNYMLVALGSPLAPEMAAMCTGGDYRLSADGTGGLRRLESMAEQADALGAIGAALK